MRVLSSCLPNTVASPTSCCLCYPFLPIQPRRTTAFFVVTAMYFVLHTLARAHKALVPVIVCGTLSSPQDFVLVVLQELRCSSCFSAFCIHCPALTHLRCCFDISGRNGGGGYIASWRAVLAGSDVGLEGLGHIPAVY